MILSTIEITNYKQYGGHHIVEIPQSGAIGVIGANGVGKTTLFEAIEWALYSPSAIKAADVRPRTWRGNTEVKVTLEDPTTGTRFIVERELGKGSAKARIYRADEHGVEEKIVDGAVQVTAYVTNNLIGLEHNAFVATFFTRQKELGFFNGSPTTRRREVGKLLGLETIRDAQQLIAEDRKRAQADARSYLAQSESQAKDRDFPMEIATAEEAIATSRQVLTTATETADAAKQATSDAEKILAESENVREQDAAIGQQILHRNREHDVAKERVSNATQALERLDALTIERQQLEPQVAQLESLQKQEQEFDSARRRASRKRELDQLITALKRRDDESISAIREEISAAPAPDTNPRWTAENPADAAEWASGIDLGALETRAANIARAVELQEAVEAESKTLTLYLKRVEDLKQTEATLREAGDPQSRIAEAQAKLQELNGSNAAARSTETRIRADLKSSENLLAGFRNQREGELCPTCMRPFTSEDTIHGIAVFEKTIEEHQKKLGEIANQVAANNAQISSIQEDVNHLNEAARKLTETRNSLEVGSQYVRDQQVKVDEANQRLLQVLQLLNRDSAPTPQERDAAQRDYLAWSKVVEAGAKVNRALLSRAGIAKEREPLDLELQSLADVSYSEDKHREATRLLQQANQAQSTILRINTDLAKRDEITAAREAASKIVSEAKRDLDDLQQQRTSLAFNIEAHQQAQARVRSAQVQEKLATERRHQADVAVREAENRLNSIRNDEARIGKLAVEAEAKQREADDLDLMYRQFTEFEKFAAAWYAPRLSEIASELVAQVTDGRYDRVEFDSDFSIKVFDGDEKFSYETFSGGERDAIALCARIALSRVIGGSSSSPPGFLVLDEVFGSLDLERRQRLLEMLSAITGADDHFRQVFIISHVDDVRTSPILDDIWQVTETDAGTSELQTLGVGVDIGEL